MNSRSIFLLAVASWAQAQTYSITDLHPDSAAESQAWAINRVGDVAGVFAQRAFLWRHDSGLQDLGTLPGFNSSIGYGVNDLGQVAGCSRNCDRGVCLYSRAFIYSSGRLIDLGAGNGSCTRAINESGQAVGAAAASAGRAFFWDGISLQYLFRDEMLDTGDLLESDARAINDAGQVAGDRSLSTWSPECYSSPYPPCHMIDTFTAIVWQNEVTLTLQDATFSAINDLGEAAGGFWQNNAGSGQAFYWSHAFYWSNGMVTDLGTLPGHNMSSAFGINVSHDVVGVSANCSSTCTDQRAVLFRAGSVLDLNTLIPADSGWFLSYATAINNAGQVVGFGRKAGQATDRAFLLTPVVQ
jgi:probable HAF family extracellular repeat protein